MITLFLKIYVIVYPKCSVDQFECLNHQCVLSAYVCDGEKDCRDGSDETHCDFGCIQGHEFRCDSTSPCISKWYKCDGFADCPNGSDEQGCGKNIDISLRDVSSRYKFFTERTGGNCTSNQFQCTIGNECIRALFRCDGDPDCADGSDEVGCSKLY